MIKIENTEVFGWKAALRGMRNPKNSWEKSDNAHCFTTDIDCPDCPLHGKVVNCLEVPIIGPNDMRLAKLLALSTPDDGKFLRMIHVQCDVTAPLYWWKEADKYQIGTVTNSCSTMHKIHAKEFTMDDFSFEHLLNIYDDIPDEEIPTIDLSPYEDGTERWSPYGISKCIIDMLNKCRDMFLETQDKRYWWQLIQLLPSSYNQKRTYDLNYAVLRNMYHARKNHKLNEWREFCKWIESLPYSELITEERK